MPNRILHERICVSETVAELSAEEERFFYRLLVQCDDYGRFDGRAAVIRARCFPLQLAQIDDQQVADWIDRLCAVDLVHRYLAGDGLTYIQVTTWERYQQTRAKRSKYPDPVAPASNGNQMQADAGNSPRIRLTRSEKREARSGGESGARAEPTPEPATEMPAAVAAPPRQAIPKVNPPGPSFAPLLDAFLELGLPVPPLDESIEIAAARKLLKRGPPGRIAQCWQEITAGDYGGHLDRIKVCFRWLNTDDLFVNWLNWKEGGSPPHAGPTRNGIGARAITKPGVRHS